MISDVEFLKIAKMPNMKILIQGKQAPITTPSPVPSLDTGLLQEKKKKRQRRKPDKWIYYIFRKSTSQQISAMRVEN